jgi:hypothetical protein
MDTDARLERDGLTLPQLSKLSLVLEREADRAYRSLEQEQEAIGLVDFATAAALQQIAAQTIMLAHEFGRALIAQFLHDRRALGQIADQQCEQHRRVEGLAHA